jgi:hypothetical protein
VKVRQTFLFNPLLSTILMRGELPYILLNMSTSQTLRVPIEIPESIKNSKYRVQFSVEHIDCDEGCAIFWHEMGPSDLRDGGEPQKKVAVLNRSEIPRWRNDIRPIALKVPLHPVHVPTAH